MDRFTLRFLASLVLVFLFLGGVTFGGDEAPKKKPGQLDALVSVCIGSGYAYLGNAVISSFYVYLHGLKLAEAVKPEVWKCFNDQQVYGFSLRTIKGFASCLKDVPNANVRSGLQRLIFDAINLWIAAKIDIAAIYGMRLLSEDVDVAYHVSKWSFLKDGGGTDDRVEASTRAFRKRALIGELAQGEFSESERKESLWKLYKAGPLKNWGEEKILCKRALLSFAYWGMPIVCMLPIDWTPEEYYKDSLCKAFRFTDGTDSRVGIYFRQWGGKR